jgi:hypothetical protein
VDEKFALREDMATMKKIVTIVFRGLMVFNKQPDRMEIGFIDALYKPGDEHAHSGETATSTGVHIPRILTMKDGIITSVFDLRNRPELGKVRNWEFVVKKPSQDTVTTFEQGGDFVRSSHPVERDFRWITDLEADDFHARPLSLEINTRQLLMVLYVRHGQFYTKLKSPPLQRTGEEQGSPYGCNAAVVGCDISFEDDGGVQLMAGGGSGAQAFNFTIEEGTIYEISNTPPDVPVEKALPVHASGHFDMYYTKLFNAEPDDKFDLILADDGTPAPDPTRCGAIYLGQRDDPL